MFTYLETQLQENFLTVTHIYGPNKNTQLALNIYLFFLFFLVHSNFSLNHIYEKLTFESHENMTMSAATFVHTNLFKLHH